MIISTKNFKKAALALSITSIFALTVPVLSEAKPGGTKSSGSRGSRSGDSVPATNTAPRTTNQSTAPTNAARAPAPQQGGFMSRFGGGIMGGLMGGLLGAGLFGLLSGSGFGAGLGSMMGFLGLLLQVALIGGLVMLAFRFFRKKQQPAMAGGAPNTQNYQAAQPMSYNAPVQPQVRERSDDVGISGEDYSAFENILTKVQDAYGREALGELKALVTPEMHHAFSEDIAENTRKGVHNQCGGAKLLSGDLAESWKENGMDYATVTIHYSLFDVTKNRATGAVVEGSMATPIEVTEHWTFVRSIGQPWILSGIDQI